MEAVYRLVRGVRGRIKAGRGLRVSGYYTLWALWAVCGVSAAGKIVPALAPTLAVCVAVVPAVSLVAFLASWSRRVSLLEAAVLADQRLELRERLSTALALEHRGGDFVAALVRDAEDHAREVAAAEVYPVVEWRYYRRAWLPTLLTAGLWFVPPLTIGSSAKSGTNTTAAQVAALTPAQQQQLNELANTVDAASAEAGALLKLDALSSDIKRLAEEVAAGRKNALQAAAEVSRVQEQLERGRETAAQKIAAVRSMGDATKIGPLTAIEQAVKRGQFSQAAQALHELGERLAEGDLSADAITTAAQRLGELAKQMENIDRGLSDALGNAARALAVAAASNTQAGRDGQQATSASAEAVSQLHNLAQEMMALQEAAIQMATLDRLAQAAASCKSGLCGGGSLASAESNSGHGQSGAQADQTGGAGQGTGAAPPVADGYPTQFQPAKADGTILPQGQVVGWMMVQGEQISGEAKAQLSAAVLESRQQEEHALTKEAVPLGYRQYVRQYFEAIDPNASAGEAAGNLSAPNETGQ